MSPKNEKAGKMDKDNIADDKNVKSAPLLKNVEAVAIVRIRGSINLNHQVRDTMEMLKLYKQNTCSIYADSPSLRGMLRKVKDFVTWGEIDEKTLKLIKNDNLENGYSRGLHPPRGGFERKGIKKSFKVGGVLGYRGPKINELIQKML